MILPTNSKILAIVFVTALAASIIAPLLLVIGLGIMLLASATQLLIQLKVQHSDADLEQDSIPQLTPMVSVHIPICNEPPELVCETILSVIKQDYPNFEIIVLDNNTTDSKIWEPVEKFCNGFSNVLFIHKERLEGYKAGALNLCRKLSAKEADFVFTVDADYVLTDSCISHAVAKALHLNVDLIQFPQAYWNVSKQTVGMEEEYRHYFNIYSRAGNSKNAVLGTGTLTLINIAALDRIGGWPQNSITEDAELGMRLQMAGLKSAFINSCVGRGIMPLDFEGIRKQRLRWVFGNFQTLINSLKALKTGATVPRESWPQLLAWVNLCGLPSIILLSHLALSVAGVVHYQPFIGNLTIGIFLLHFTAKFLLFLKSTGYRLIPSFLALLTHLSMMEEGAFGWWDALVGAQKPFERTNKFSSKSAMRRLPVALPAILVVSAAMLLFLNHALAGMITITLAILFIISGMFTAYQVNHARLLFQSKV